MLKKLKMMSLKMKMKRMIQVRSKIQKIIPLMMKVYMIFKKRRKNKIMVRILEMKRGQKAIGKKT